MEAVQTLEKKEKDDRSRPVYVSREWHRKLRIIAAARDVRVGSLIEEALDCAFGSEAGEVKTDIHHQSHGKKPAKR